MDTAFSTSSKREQFADFNKSMATNKSSNAKVEPAPIDSTADTNQLVTDPTAHIEEPGRPGVRIVRIPSKRLPKDGDKSPPKVKKTVKPGDADDLELGDEASTIKKDGEKEEEEEDADVQIEVVDCFPLICTNK